MLNARLWRLFAIASLAVIAGVTILTAQTATPSGSTNSPMDQLLAEVRGLRAEVNQAASASVRAQLLVARLQLQEQRINVLGGQLAEVRRLITTLESGQTQVATQLKSLEESSRRVNPVPEDIEMMVARLKAQLAQTQREEQQLRMQETELSNQLTAEQGRWFDFNARLDELERQLLNR
jgi:septal ring factor EnvC (AmiA/AmiB activator)